MWQQLNVLNHAGMVKRFELLFRPNIRMGMHDRNDLDCGMIVGWQKGWFDHLRYSRIFTHKSLKFTENAAKNKKHSVSSRCMGENALLIRGQTRMTRQEVTWYIGVKIHLGKIFLLKHCYIVTCHLAPDWCKMTGGNLVHRCKDPYR